MSLRARPAAVERATVSGSPRAHAARPRGIAFDLGGVLYDVDVARLARAAGQTLGAAPRDLEAAVFGGGLWQRLEIGAVDGDAFVDVVLQRLGVAATPATRTALREAWCAILRLRPGVDALLARVRGACLVWSNTDPLHAAAIRAEPCLANRVAHWSTSYALGVEKPCAAFFERALAQAACAPWQVVYVDDRAENVAQARALGVDAFVATSLAGVWTGLAARRLLAR